ECHPIEFGESAVVYGIRYWISDFENDSAIDGEVRTRIWYAAGRSGLDIPFPTRTIVSMAGDGARPAHDAELGEAARLEALSRSPLFSGLPKEDLELLAHEAKTVRFAAGETIVSQMDAGDSLYIVHRGDVGVTLAADSARRQVAVLRAGDVF